jgi:hypothetical protein
MSLSYSAVVPSVASGEILEELLRGITHPFARPGRRVSRLVISFAWKLGEGFWRTAFLHLQSELRTET